MSFDKLIGWCLLVICLSLTPTIRCDVKCEFDQHQQPPHTNCLVRRTPDNITGNVFDIAAIDRPEIINSVTLATKLKLKTFPHKIFDRFPELLVLVLDDAGIETLSSDVFLGAANLLTLALSDNNLRSIHAATFIHLSSLDILEVNRNEIEAIDDRAFLGLENLKLLSLESNGIRSLTFETFYGLRNLQELHLSHNELQYIDESSFVLSELTVLTLGFNRLKSLPHDLCAHSKKLNTVSIWNNEITSIGGVFIGCDDLQFIYMDNNLIGDVDLLELANLRNLESFTLSNNSLRLTGYQDTPTNSSVTMISFCSNRLFNPNIFKQLTMFSGLKTLLLNDNEFTHFDDIHEIPRSFPQLERIEVINNSGLQQWVTDNSHHFQQLNISVIIVDDEESHDLL